MEFITKLLIDTAPYVHIISFVLLILAGFNLPISEDLVFIVSASIAATIVPENSHLIFAGCFLGAYISDLIAYSIGRYGINWLIRFNTFKKILTDKRINKIKNYFNRYGGKTLFFGRFIPFGVRNMLFITSGLVRMRILKFMIIDLIALILTSTILFSLGYSFGKNYKLVLDNIQKYKIIIFALFVFIIIVLIFKNKIFLNKQD